MCAHAPPRKKLGGIVVDGAIRDVDGITALGFPAFSRSVSPGGCDKDGPGEINVPDQLRRHRRPWPAISSSAIATASPSCRARTRRKSWQLVRRARRREEAQRIARDSTPARSSRPDIDDTLRKKGVIE